MSEHQQDSNVNNEENVNEEVLSTEEEVKEAEQAVTEELDKLKNELLRALAETENVRKRAEREREDIKSYAVSSFAKDLLSSAENLERSMLALSALNDDIKTDQSVKPIIDGIEITFKELNSALERNSIRKVEAEKGVAFDHNMHQAISTVFHDEIEANKIVEVVQTGYFLRDRLLRPALVIVSSGQKDS